MVTQWCGRQLSECSDIGQEPWGLKQKGQIYYNYYNGIEMQTNTYISCILCFTKCINLYKYNIPIGKKYELCKQDFMNEYQLVFNCCYFCKNISKYRYLDITIVNECTSFIISNIYHHTHHSNFCVKCMLMKKCRN